MSRLTPELVRELVTEARLAPSVHNIQPTRWRLLDNGRLALIDDTNVRIPIADPAGHDVLISHGAALEGMNLALNRRHLSIADMMTTVQPLSQQYTALCTFAVNEGAVFDSLTDHVTHRMSWRGKFATSPNDAIALAQLAEDGVICVSDRQAIANIADWADRAEYSFVRRNDYRQELLDWMRLSRRHPRYLQDGLNRDALHMNTIEAAAARLLLGSLFEPLDKLGLAEPFLADDAKTVSASTIILFFRPVTEDLLTTGRHFYRTWLKITQAGFAACPMSTLADHPDLNKRIRELSKVEPSLRLVNAFRVGRPLQPQKFQHFRLSIDRLMV